MTPRVATEAEARALASALRLRILRICLGEPHTNKEIATALGRDPATTLHHVRRLVETGFLLAQEARRGTRGAREVPYLATKKSWEIDIRPHDRAPLDAFLEESALSAPEQLSMARLGVRMRPERLDYFRGRLDELLQEIADETDDPTGEAWSIFLAIHPDVSRATANGSPAPSEPSTS